jgi:hypothetical protein
MASGQLIPSKSEKILENQLKLAQQEIELSPKGMVRLVALGLHVITQSKSSHLPYVNTRRRNSLRRDGETDHFHAKCVHEYSTVEAVLAALLRCLVRRSEIKKLREYKEFKKKRHKPKYKHTGGNGGNKNRRTKNGRRRKIKKNRQVRKNKRR